MTDIVNDLRLLYRQEKDEAHKRAADEIERLRARVEELEREVAAHRKYIERITNGGTDYDGLPLIFSISSFDDLIEAGLIVTVPPTPEYIEEWGDDCEMWVLAWKAHEFEEVE